MFQRTHRARQVHVTPTEPHPLEYALLAESRCERVNVDEVARLRAIEERQEFHSSKFHRSEGRSGR